MIRTDRTVTMKIVILTLTLALAHSAASLQELSAAEAVYEEFSSMVSWDDLFFDKIDKHTSYSIVEEGENSILKIESVSSASGIIFTETFPVNDFPVIEWRWRAENIISKGNATKKSGDDYPVRIYVLFPYDPAEVSFFERIAFEAAKALYGEYPPMASLNYIWANREHEQWAIPNPFTARAMMIPVEEGAGNLGKWREYRVNLIDDYLRAFGKEPPATASLAIMGDTDNTGSSATAYIDYIRVIATTGGAADDR